jgi:hypothetical protein
MPEPPVCVPLRILGLNYMPTTKEAVRQAFRFKMFAAHPDLNPDHPPAEAQADVQELVWARDWLVRKIPDPVTPNANSTAGSISRYRCRRCGRPEAVFRSEKNTVRLIRYGRWWRHCRLCAREAEKSRQRDLRAQARADRRCQSPECAALFTPARSDAKFCSSACRQKAFRRRDTTEVRQ